MKKLFASTILLAATLTANAGSLIWYDSKKEGEIEFRLIPGTQIRAFSYDQDSKELIAGPLLPHPHFWRFGKKVDTPEEAHKIIRQLLDENNASLIEFDEEL